MTTAEDIVNKTQRKMVTAPPNTVVFDALQVMAKNKTGSIFVEEDGKIVGIWTERDLLRESIKEGFDTKVSTIGESMSTNLISAPHDASVFKLMDICITKYIRRIPIMKKGDYIGMIYVFDLFEDILAKKNEELKKLNEIANLEYYKPSWHRTRR